MRKRIITIGVLAIFTLALCACSQGETSGNNMPEDAEIGMVYTTEDRDSKIEWLDKELNTIGVSKLSSSSLGNAVGFQNTVYDKSGNCILLAQGASEKDGKVIKVDKAKRKLEEIKVPVFNATSWGADDNSLAIASNLNWEGNVHLVDIETGDVNKLIVPEKKILDSLCLVDDKIYGIATDDAENHSIACFDIQKESMKMLLDVGSGEDTTFIQHHDGKLFFIMDGELAEFDIKSGDLKRTKLTNDKAFNILIQDETLWIAYTDIHSEDKSLIEARDIKSGKVLKSVNFGGSVWQLEVNKDKLYVMGFNELKEYSIDGNEMTEEKSISLEADEYNAVGIFTLDNVK